MKNLEIERINKIAELNDGLRKGEITGRILVTPGITALSPVDRGVIIEQVKNFSDFTPDNDPYGEHDFGAFEHDGLKIFWKIDYYNLDLTAGSESPEDPHRTERVLTIMLADEY